MKYVVHPGNGKTSPKSSIAYIDAGTLASLYGLQPSDYTLSNDFAPDSIHLVPRVDGVYQNIKTELGDNGQTYHQDNPAFFYVSRDGRHKNKRQMQPQYKDTFRDKRVGRDDTNIL